MNPTSVLMALALATPPVTLGAASPPVDCFGPGTDALKAGRGVVALAAFQAAFSHPGCRYHRGGLLLNIAAAFEQVAEQTGESRYICAAAVHYLNVVEEPATPTMISAARRGADAARERCPDDRLGRPSVYGEMGLEEVFDESSSTVLATTLTVAAVGAITAGGVFLALASEDDATYQREREVTGGDVAALDAGNTRAGLTYRDLTRHETLGVTLMAVGGGLTLTSIWAWLDVGRSGLAFAPSGAGATMWGVW